MKLLLPFLLLVFALSAAAQTLNGSLVQADNMDKPIRNSIVQLTDTTTGAIRFSAVNPFGHFRFPGIVFGRQYNLEVKSKQYLFGKSTVVTNSDGIEFLLSGYKNYPPQ